MSFSDIKSGTSKYLADTYARFDIALEKGKDCILYDSEGKKYIDFTSGIGVNCLGHANPIIINTIKEQADKLLHMSNLYHNSQQVKAAKKLVELSKLKKVFFSNSGAEANECAIKIARKYSSDKYNDNRTDIVTLKNSFHGRTITTLSATGQDEMRKYFHPFTKGFSYADADNINSIKQHLTDKTCAVMLELIQGEGGVLPLDEKFVNKLYNLCHDKDILFIVDEVQTGIARTGTMFCFEQYGVKPDIVTLAKGLGGGFPIGAVLCDEKVKHTLSPSTHGSTFGGNPMACAVATAVLNTVSEKKFLMNVKEKGNYFRKKLSGIKNISNIRGRGLMLGFDIENMSAREAAGRCAESGLLVLTAKDAVRLLPPLIIDYADIDSGIHILNEIINK